MYTSLICACLSALALATTLPENLKPQWNIALRHVKGGPDLQTFTGTLGSVAPPVYDDSNGRYVTNGGTFIHRADAMKSSCQAQRVACFGVTNSAICTRQLYACMRQAAKAGTTPH